MTSNTPSLELVKHVNALLPEDGLTDEQVNRVIVAYQAVHEGAPIGTVMLDPVSGDVAKRVVIDGVHKWQVISEGGLKFDTRPVLEGWVSVSAPGV